MKTALCAVSLVLLTALGCSHAPDQSVGLHEEASTLVERGLEQEKNSYVDAYQLYRSALNDLKTIAELYPDSAAAGAIGTGELTVGPFTVDQLYAHARETGLRAEAESEPAAAARYVVNSISEPANRAKLLARLAVARFRDEAADEARALLSEAGQAVALIEDDSDKALATVELVAAYARVGDMDSATGQVASIAADQPVAEVGAMAALSRARREQGDLAGAKHYRGEAQRVVASMNESTAGRDSALVELALLYADSEDDVEARKIASRIVDQGARVRVYAVAGAVRNAAGRREAGLDWLDRGVRIATGIEEPYTLSTALGEISAGYDELGEADRAEQLLSQSLSVAMGMDEFSSVKAGALAKVARKYARAGQYDMAFVIAEAMIDSHGSDKSWAKAGIAHYFAEKGDFERALPVIFSIQKNEVKIMTLAELMIEYTSVTRGSEGADTHLLHYVIRELG